MQEWKARAGALEEEVLQLRQHQQVLQGKLGLVQQLARGGSGVAYAEATPPRAAQAAVEEGAPASQPPQAASAGCLDALAAEYGQCVSAGRSEGACRFLAEVRSHQAACAGAAAQRQDGSHGITMPPAQQQATTPVPGSPLHAVGAFVLGPLMRARRSGLQAALATDACDFVCQEVGARGGEAATQAALQSLVPGAGRTAHRSLQLLSVKTFSSILAHTCLAYGSPGIHGRYMPDCFGLLLCAGLIDAIMDGAGADSEESRAQQPEPDVLEAAGASTLLCTHGGLYAMDQDSPDTAVCAGNATGLPAGRDLAADLLAALLQLPAAGTLVLRVTAQRLRAHAEQLAASCSGCASAQATLLMLMN